MTEKLPPDLTDADAIRLFDLARTNPRAAAEFGRELVASRRATEIIDRDDKSNLQNQADYWYSKRATPEQKAAARAMGYGKLVPNAEKIKIGRTLRGTGP